MKNFLRLIFDLFQKLKINILPNHYYSSIPDFGFLSTQSYWKKSRSMYGVQGTDIAQQVAFAKDCVDSITDKSVLTNQNIIKAAREEQNEMGYGTVEADFLYCFVHRHRPHKVIQIGCGVSTSIILRASEATSSQVEIVCVEPYPSKYLKQMAADNKIKLISEAAQTVPLELLTDLSEGDMLFIDSTHTVKVGSEVNRIILEVLPRLSKGVFVHFHDIYFPYDYQRNLEDTLFFWGESTLLHAFLINNPHYTIRQSQSMFHYQTQETLKDLFPNYHPEDDNEGLRSGEMQGKNFPASTYLEVV